MLVKLLALWVVNNPLGFSKVMCELVVYWRAKGIYILPYFGDFLFLVMRYDARCLLAKIVEEDMRRAGLAINWDKSDGPLSTSDCILNSMGT